MKLRSVLPSCFQLSPVIVDCCWLVDRVWDYFTLRVYWLVLLDSRRPVILSSSVLIYPSICPVWAPGL